MPKQEGKEGVPKVKVWIRDRYSGQMPAQPAEVVQAGLEMVNGEPVLKFKTDEFSSTFIAHYKEGQWEADALD